MDSVAFSLMTSRVVQAAQVPTQVARKLLRAGMDESTAIEWATAWRRTGRDLDQVIRVWKLSEGRGRRRSQRRGERA